MDDGKFKTGFEVAKRDMKRGLSPAAVLAYVHPRDTADWRDGVAACVDAYLGWQSARTQRAARLGLGVL